jgi:hypothetical protein
LEIVIGYGIHDLREASEKSGVCTTPCRDLKRSD